MARAAAEKNGVACFDTFTGFKFLAEKIKQFEKDGSHEYIFAFEESYGYLCGDYARDKDAVTASMLIAEMAAYYRTQGKTLYDAMEEMYEKYGCYCEQTISIVMPGVSGLQRMKELMQELRDKPLTADRHRTRSTYTRDYMPGTRTCMADGRVRADGAQGSERDVLRARGRHDLYHPSVRHRAEGQGLHHGQGREQGRGRRRRSRLWRLPRRKSSSNSPILTEYTKSGPVQGKNPFAPGRGICCANSCPLPRAGRE